MRASVFAAMSTPELEPTPTTPLSNTNVSCPQRANSPIPIKPTRRSIAVEKVLLGLYDGDNTFNWCQGFYTGDMPWTLQRNVELVRPL